MKKKQIKQAAERYAESIAQSDIKKGYSIDDFMAGAHWRMNSVWHNVSEAPEDRRMLLCVSDFRLPLICGPDNSGFALTARRFDITRWAYIDDLIPEL